MKLKSAKGDTKRIQRKIISRWSTAQSEDKLQRPAHMNRVKLLYQFNLQNKHNHKQSNHQVREKNKTKMVSAKSDTTICIPMK